MYFLINLAIAKPLSFFTKSDVFGENRSYDLYHSYFFSKVNAQHHIANQPYNFNDADLPFSRSMGEALPFCFSRRWF